MLNKFVFAVLLANFALADGGANTANAPEHKVPPQEVKKEEVKVHTKEEVKTPVKHDAKKHVPAKKHPDKK